MSRGEHRITPAKRAEKSPDDGEFGLFHVLFYLFLLIVILSGLGGGGSERPPPPAPPAHRTATFTASGNTSAPILVLGGGSLNIVYMSEALAIEGSFAEPIFEIDFRTNVSSGNLKTANTIVINGDCNLEIGSIGLFDVLNARVIQKGGLILANFDFQQRARGPPTSLPQAKQTKTVIIRNSIDNMKFGKSYGSAERKIEVYDLDPGDAEWARHQEKLERWRHGEGEYRPRVEPRPVRPLGR